MKRLILSLLACWTLLACVPTVMETEPPGGTIPHNTVVFVDDGACPNNQIKKLTGGNDNLGVPRKSECVPRP